jgi:gas vesicle protein
MEKGNNDLMTFLFGAAIGVGIGLYLNSKSGREMRSKTANKMSDLESTIEDKVNEALEKLKGKVNQAATKVKERTEA